MHAHPMISQQYAEVSIDFKCTHTSVPLIFLPLILLCFPRIHFMEWQYNSKSFLYFVVRQTAYSSVLKVSATSSESITNHLTVSPCRCNAVISLFSLISEWAKHSNRSFTRCSPFAARHTLSIKMVWQHFPSVGSVIVNETAASISSFRVSCVSSQTLTLSAYIEQLEHRIFVKQSFWISHSVTTNSVRSKTSVWYMCHEINQMKEK